jgi:hypothetical protein
MNNYAGTGFYQWREAHTLTGRSLPSWFPDDMRVTVEPVGLVVPVQLIKAGLPSPNMVNDDLITLDIQAVTDQIEKYLRRDLLTRTRQAIYFRPGDSVFVIPVPVATISLVQGVDKEGTAYTLTADEDYYTRGYGDNVQIYGINNPYEYLQVTYTTGYGASADVPAAIRKAIVQEVFRQFKRRQDPIIASDTIVDSLSSEAQSLIRSYLVRRSM